MGSYTIRNDIVPDLFDAKARAAIRGLRFATDMRFSYIEIEGDSHSIIRKISGKQLDRSSISVIIEDGTTLPRVFY
ncbi:hypothetical protein Goklo_013310 [Gossypium klotzschianum]|uniref:RNase H type-1 domain-containing protein n=1 Tax=Gossypium klotzschianum TaxID=34286 RepID=A0A7J8U3V7_9ROSI|nr:hypothetical protein [Gossypium klotzschianum]